MLVGAIWLAYDMDCANDLITVFVCVCVCVCPVGRAEVGSRSLRIG